MLSTLLLGGAILELYSLVMLCAARRTSVRGTHRMVVAVVATVFAVQGLIGLAMQ